MISFNILGDCVSRDIVTPLIEQEKAQVIKYTAFSNPISMLSAKPNFELSMDDLTIEDTNFRKRCFLFDYNKNSLNYILEEKSDYLIFDILDARLRLMQKDGHYISLTKYSKKFIAQFKSVW